MSFIVILIVLGVQRYLQFYSHAYHPHWLAAYWQEMNKRFSRYMQTHSLLSLLILILPLVFVVAVVFAFFYHALGIIAYFLLNIVFFWYCVDARDLHKHPYVGDTADFFVLSYKKLFAKIFWFAIAGPVGLAFYFSIEQLHDYLISSAGEKQELQQRVAWVRGLLDWLPMRCLGLSFALVGHFVDGLQALTSELLTGIRCNQAQVVTWGLAAMQTSATELSQRKKQLIDFLNHALLLWLVVMALVNIATWLR